MKLEGDVGACGLADIIHLLSSTARQGVLVVAKGALRRKLYFGPEGVTLFYDASRASHLLGQVLTARGVINDQVLKTTLKRQRDTGLPLGEILCRSGAARPEDVEDALAYQLREEFFHLLTWGNAHFEFHEGAEHPIDPGRRYSRTPTFNTNAIIMEAARRADEWQRNRLVISSEQAVPVRTSADVTLPEDPADADLAADVLDLADGTFCVHQMVKRLRRSEFEVYECVCSLLDAGVLRIADARELADAAAAELQASNPERVQRLLVSAAGCSDGDAELHHEMGRMFLRVGDEENARDSLDIVLRGLVDRKLDAQIEQMLGQIGLEFPDVPYSYERRLKLLDPTEDLEHAFPLADRLLDIYDQRRNSSATTTMLRYLNTFGAKTTEDHLRLAGMQESHGGATAAARRYYLAANQRRYAGSRAEAMRHYQKALSLDGHLSAARQELSCMLQAPRRRARGVLIATLGVLTAIAVLSGGAFVVYREHVAEQDLNRVRVVAEGLVEQHEYDKARAAYTRLLKDHAYTTVSAEVAGLLAQIERRRDSHVDTTRDTERQLLKGAADAEQHVDLERAITDYERLAGIAVTDGLAQQAREHLRRLRAEKDDYGRLLASGREHETDRNYTQAVQSYLAARRRSRRLFDHEGVKLPLVIESVPAGAEIAIGGKTVGKTPHVLRRGVEAAMSPVIRLAGFSDRAVEIPADSTQAVVRVEMIPSRLPLWTVKLKGGVDQPACIAGKTCYLTTREGRLYALSLETGRVLWARTLGTTPGEYVSTPVLVRESLLVSTMDGSVIAVSRGDGRELWRKRGQGLPAGPPGRLGAEGLITLLHPAGTVDLLDAGQGNRVRQLSLPSPVVGSPLIAGNMLYYATSDYGVQAFDLKNAAARWKWRAGCAVTEDMASDEGMLYVPRRDMGLAAVSVDRGGVQWRYDASGEHVTAVSAGRGRVHVVTREGSVIALDGMSGRVVWRSSAGAKVSAAPAADSAHVYVATETGWLTVFSASDGRLLWKSDLAGPPAAPPATVGDRLLIATTDGTVQTFNRR